MYHQNTPEAPIILSFVAMGAAMINWCGSFDIAGCCKYLSFESRVSYIKKKKEKSWGMIRGYDSEYDSGVWLEVPVRLFLLKFWTHEKNTYPYIMYVSH